MTSHHQVQTAKIGQGQREKGNRAAGRNDSTPLGHFSVPLTNRAPRKRPPPLRSCAVVWGCQSEGRVCSLHHTQPVSVTLEEAGVYDNLTEFQRRIFDLFCFQYIVQVSLCSVLVARRRCVFSVFGRCFDDDPHTISLHACRGRICRPRCRTFLVSLTILVGSIQTPMLMSSCQVCSCDVIVQL